MVRKSQRTAGWKLALVAGAALMVAACNTPAAPPTPTPVPIPAVTVDVSDTALTVPAEMPAGLVAVTVKNSGQSPHSPFFARLNEGVSADSFMQTLQTDESGAAAIAQVTLLGGAQVAPGASQRMVLICSRAATSPWISARDREQARRRSSASRSRPATVRRRPSRLRWSTPG